MSIQMRLIVMNFLQFFIWGAWLISLGGYMGGVLHFDGTQIGSVFASMGIASLFMPGVLGIIADKFIPAQQLLGICHLIGAALLITASTLTDFIPFYWVILGAVMCYMPTLSLSNSVAYNALQRSNMDIVKSFPPIRVWGTVGFIVAMWMVDLLGFSRTNMQLYVSATASLLLGLYSFTLPNCVICKNKQRKSLLSAFGLDALVLFKRPKMAIFFIFSMLLGAALQVTNAFGGSFLDSFGEIEQYKNSFGVLHPNILLSISQMSETLFILAIPFCLRYLGIKRVMMMSMLAWVLRFGLFGFGDPGAGLWMLILSMLVYGMAFDFFNISGSLFVELESDSSIRSSAQGLFVIMTNGIGSTIGGYASGWVVSHYTANNVADWQTIWLVFAGYALVVAILFGILFRYKHDPKSITNVQH